MTTKQKQIEQLLKRGVNEVIDYDHLKKQLLANKKLRVKLGIDPTSPHLHLGHAVNLLKLRDFQELGHQIILIIGDFTGLIGDTSGQERERPMLSPAEVKKNMKTYQSQIRKILEPEKTEVKYNSEWLSKLNYTQIAQQADQFSLAEFINRQNIKRRLQAGQRISLREVLYPLLQAYDSLAVKADVEIGGTDQRFNLLAGRTLQAYYNQKPQDILMTNLIPGTDGRKMSKTFKNTINLTAKPNEMFGQLMTINDNLIIPYFEHCTRVALEKIKEYQQALQSQQTNPRDIKMALAFEITQFFWGKEKANKAQEYFIRVFQKKDLPLKMASIKLAGQTILQGLVSSKLASSRSQARRLLNQRGIKINGRLVKSMEEKIKKGDIIQKGKRHFIKAI